MPNPEDIAIINELWKIPFQFIIKGIKTMKESRLDRIEKDLDHRLMGGMGALVVKDAEKAELYVLTQNGDGGAMLINPKNFRAKEFL